jgi:hypothetical protein
MILLRQSTHNTRYGFAGIYFFEVPLAVYHQEDVEE